MLRGQVAANDLVFGERHLESIDNRVSASPSSRAWASHPASNPLSAAEIWHGEAAEWALGAYDGDRYSL